MIKKTISLLLSVLLILVCAFPAFAVTEDEWNTYWETEESQSGIIMYPGSDETGRNFSWYSEKESTPTVTVTESGATKSEDFSGYCVKTQNNTYANKVTVTGLKEGTTYTYVCKSEGYTSEPYTFTTVSGSDFSAMYVTDVHISYSESDAGQLKTNSMNLSNVIEAAKEKDQNVSLLLSAGDQASLGLEKEYRGFSSSPAFRTLTAVTALGNHDRKNIDYKTFKNVPNERTKNIAGSYDTGDYWFVKGDTLFMVMESNNGSGLDHSAFMRSAINANKDVKWRVVIMHHDLYSARIEHRESENKLLRALWSPLFSQYQIDLALLGHSHYYSESNVLYNGKVTQNTSKDCTLTNPAGTVSFVSGSINRPRNDSDLGTSENIGYYYDEQADQVVYNIIDFSEDSIVVRSYSYTTGEQFNSLTIKKDSQQGGHPKGFNLLSPIINVIGTIYSFFNNFSVYSNLKDAGVDISLTEVLFGN